MSEGKDERPKAPQARASERRLQHAIRDAVMPILGTRPARTVRPSASSYPSNR